MSMPAHRSQTLCQTQASLDSSWCVLLFRPQHVCCLRWVARCQIGFAVLPSQLLHITTRCGIRHGNGHGNTHPESFDIVNSAI